MNVCVKFERVNIRYRSWGSSVNVLSDYILDDGGLILSRDKFSLALVSRPDLRPT
jgi:hypothetical protein